MNHFSSPHFFQKNKKVTALSLWQGTRASVYVWRSEDNLLTLLFHPVGPGDKTQVVRFGGKVPLPTGPFHQPKFCHF